MFNIIGFNLFAVRYIEVDFAGLSPVGTQNRVHTLSVVWRCPLFRVSVSRGFPLYLLFLLNIMYYFTFLLQSSIFLEGLEPRPVPIILKKLPRT